MGRPISTLIPQPLKIEKVGHIGYALPKFLIRKQLNTRACSLMIIITYTHRILAGGTEILLSLEAGLQVLPQERRLQHLWGVLDA